MTDYNKSPMFQAIRANISKYGHHITLVAGGSVPRFGYAIGISPIVGAELVFAGGAFYSVEDVKRITNGIAKDPVTTFTPDHSIVAIDGLGSFSLRQADLSWSGALMLGALDFYQSSGIPVFPHSAGQFALDTRHPGSYAPLERKIRACLAVSA
jgi:hypothetical protein